MLQGKFPFKGISDTDLFKKIKKGMFIHTHPISANAQSMIKMLLSPHPAERPTAP